MFAIVGAAGKIGFSTSVVLRKAGLPVRAIVRDASKAGPLREIGCEVVEADLQDPQALARSISNAHAVQIICPPMPQEQDALGDMRKSIESLASALEQARPKLLLAISDYGAHVEKDVGMPTAFHLFEERLRQIDIPKVLLRSAEHMEGWAPLIPVAIASSALPSLHHPLDAPFPTVSAHDVGIIAADLLQHPAVESGEQVVHAEGPRRYSANDVAAGLTELLRRSIGAQELPRSMWQETLEQLVSASTAQLLSKLYDAHNSGLIDIEPGQGDVRYGKTELIDALRPLIPLQ